MEFLKKRVKKYQEKKLDEALSKVKFHTKMKIQLENEILKTKGSDQNLIKKEISFHEKMLSIWENNTKKIKNEMNKIDK